MILPNGKKQKRRITKLRIEEFSGVDKPAMEGALALIFKRGAAMPEPEDDEDEDAFVARFMSSKPMKKEFADDKQRLAAGHRQYHSSKKNQRIEKYCDHVPLMTSEEDGHVHLVWIGRSSAGETSYSSTSESAHGHTHPWMVGASGELVVGANQDHTHTVDQAALLAAMRELIIESTDAPSVATDVVFARADDAPVDISKLGNEALLAALASGAIVMKNTDGELLDTDVAMPDGSFPIRCNADLLTAIELVGGDGDQRQAALHIVKRARALGLESELPEDGPLAEIAKTGPATSTTKKDKPQMTGKQEPAAGGGVDLQKQLDAMQAENATLKKSLATATAVASLSDAERAHYSALKSDEAKSTFLSKSQPDRAREIEEIRKGDPVLYKAADGTEFRASDGDRVIAIAKRADETARRLALSEAARADEALMKRAELELSGLPGTVQVRAALLKAVGDITDEAIRTSAMESLRAGNAALAKTSRPLGTREAPSGASSASAELDRLAKAHVTAHPTTNFYDAYDLVAKANPELAKRAIEEPGILVEA